MPIIVSDGQVYRITAVFNGLALDVRDSSTEPDAPVVQNPVNLDSTSQQWGVQVLGDQTISLLNITSGMALSVYYGKTEPGAVLVQYPNHTWSDQRWTLASTGDDAAGIAAIHSTLNNLLIDVPGGTVIWNTQLDLWPPSGGPMPNGGTYLGANQAFLFTFVGSFQS